MSKMSSGAAAPGGFFPAGGAKTPEAVGGAVRGRRIGWSNTEEGEREKDCRERQTEAENRKGSFHRCLRERFLKKDDQRCHRED